MSLALSKTNAYLRAIKYGWPHWSESVAEWRHDRWDPMCNAPHTALEIRGRDAKGKILEPMHYASDLSGEDQPAFIGWFVPVKDSTAKKILYFDQVFPVEWQPLRATYELKGAHNADNAG